VDGWTVLFWTLAVTGGLGALYGLHLLGLWMEERGYLYYLHKKPKGSAAGCFVALQKALEPNVQHVIQVSRVNHLHGEEGASGRDDSVNSDAKPADESRAQNTT
jgi:hypothetical protein